MRSLSALFVAVVAFFSGCARSHAQAPKEYTYEYPCSTWAEPARVVTNQDVGRADTTLAMLSGRVLNFDKGDYGETYPVYVIATQGASAKKEVVFTDKTGFFHLYLPAGTYRVEFSGMGFSPYTVDALALQSGQKHRIELLLHVSIATRGTCIFKSKRKLSPKQLDALLARAEARRARLYQQQMAAEASAQPKN